jgi:hypothetical protein
MPDTIPDLWPDEVAVTDVITPLAILNYQASQLRQKTKNLLEAEVSTDHVSKKGYVLHHFELIAPALGRYRYRLFTAGHKDEFVYPVEVKTNEGEEPIEAATQQEFLKVLGQVLWSSRARSVIQSLIAQSNDAHGQNAT